MEGEPLFVEDLDGHKLAVAYLERSGRFRLDISGGRVGGIQSRTIPAEYDPRQHGIAGEDMLSIVRAARRIIRDLGRA